MIVDFVRSQERNFEKALKRALELGMPPPEVVQHMDTLDFGMEIVSVTTPLMPKQSKSEVDHLCHYFNSLYHTLAPLHSSASHSFSTTHSPIPDDPDQEQSHNPPLTNDSTSIRSTSPNRFRFSSSASSSSLTPGTPDQLEPTLKSLHCGHQRQVTEESNLLLSTSIIGSDSSMEALHESDNDMQFSFRVPQTGGAPIPVPVPVSQSRETLGAVPATWGLSETFWRSRDTAVDIPLSESRMHLQNVANNEGQCRKRKRTPNVTGLPPSDLEALHQNALTAGQMAKLAHQTARRKELEMSVAKAKQTVHGPLSNSRLCRRQIITDATLGIDGIAHEERMAGLRCQLANIRRERESQQLRSLRHKWDFARFLTPLTNICNEILYTFLRPGQELEWQQVLEPLRREIQSLMQEPTNYDLVKRSDVIKCSRIANQIQRLCRIRIDLLHGIGATKRGSTKASRPYLQRRHRRDTNPFDLLKKWYLANSSNPYPTKKCKVELSQQTGLSLQSVTHWFANARSRGKYSPLTSLDNLMK